MKRKKAIVFGAGQLGTISSIGLCKSGIGEVRLADRDKVELRNVNTQILYSLEDIGKPKVEVLAKGLRALAPWTKVVYRKIEVLSGGEEDAIYERRMRELSKFMKGCDVALSCLDNVRSRITVNLLCRNLDIPLIDAGCYGLNGQVLVTVWGETPCLGCLDAKGKADISCAIAPTTVATGFAVSSVQVQLTIDLLHQRKVPSYVAIDLGGFVVKPVEIKRREDCWICDQNGQRIC
jgi:adenylyltransferase/sulfurtransferase